MLINKDPYRCFMPYPPEILENSDSGILARTDFAVKDIIRVEGYPTSGGNPTWAENFGSSDLSTASVVQQLMDAGAECMGKTVTDELAYSHIGSNAHYGAPINPKAVSRYCGGSSCGSAAAVAGSLVDFALGTDTGGSVRGPASFCGIWGIRPTQSRISLDGIMPLAPSYDTLGWFARTPDMMEKVGSVLLGSDSAPLAEKPEILVPIDVLELMDTRYKEGFLRFEERFNETFLPTQEIDLIGGFDFEKDWFDCFRISQGAEVWETHKKWVIEFQPALGDGVYERFEMISELEKSEIMKAKFQRAQLANHVNNKLDGGKVILMPTAMRTAFPRSMPLEDITAQRVSHVGIMSFAGIAGAPQISMPLMEIDGAPFGISVMASKGSDVALLALAHRISLATGVVY